MKKTYFFLLLLLSISLSSCTEDGALSGTEEAYADDGFASSDTGGGSSGGGSGDGSQDNSGIVTAGEWNDLTNWSFWQNLLNQEEADTFTTNWKFNTANRFSFQLTDANNLPAVDISVSVRQGATIIWEAKTDNHGTAELWVDLKNNSQKATDVATYKFYIGNEQLFTTIKPFSEGINSIQLNTSTPVFTKVDLAFIVDATGSMGDEMEFLKDDLKQVIQDVKNTNGNLQITTGTVFYRDVGDDYVVKKSDFTSSLESTLGFINEQKAEGGGDFPEAVHTALKTGISELQWSNEARSRIAFLLLDAPPHQKNQIVDELHNTIKTAAKKGIKIIPIVASGIDKETEFLMRNFSIATNGTYVFITNDSGVGHEHLEPTVGEYEVEYLKDLMVRLIKKYSE